ncbi:MAG: hypothetical protein O2807_00590 [bacterium]|nr:hypothetical protein [bacterium]
MKTAILEEACHEKGSGFRRCRIHLAFRGGICRGGIQNIEIHGNHGIGKRAGQGVAETLFVWRGKRIRTGEFLSQPEKIADNFLSAAEVHDEFGFFHGNLHKLFVLTSREESSGNGEGEIPTD